MSDSPLETDELRRRDVDDVGRQVLGGDLERDPGPRRGLVEQDRHLPAAQGRDLRDRPGQDLAHRVGRAHDELELGGRQAVDVEQVTMPPGDGAGSRRGVDGPGPRPPATSPWRAGVRSIPTLTRPGSAAGSAATARSRRRPRRRSPRGGHGRVSSRDVGTFLPTWSARIGSSRWPRSTRTARRIACGPAEVDQGVHRGPDRPAGVQDVVDEDDRPTVDAGREVRALDHRLLGDHRQVVAVERDVERPDRDLDALVLRDRGGDPVGERDAATLDADRGAGPRCRPASRRSRGTGGSSLGGSRPRS